MPILQQLAVYNKLNYVNFCKPLFQIGTTDEICLRITRRFRLSGICYKIAVSKVKVTGRKEIHDRRNFSYQSKSAFGRRR